MLASSGTLDAILSWSASVLTYVNPVRGSERFGPEAFMGFVSLGIALIVWSVVWPVASKKLENEGTAILVAGGAAFLGAGSIYRMGGDELGIAEAFCFGMGGSLRLIEGLCMAVGVFALVRGKSLRGRTIDKQLMVHPVVLGYVGVQTLFYLAGRDVDQMGIGGWLWVGVSVCVAAISFAGLFTLIYSTFEDAPIAIQVSVLASGLGLWMLLANIYLPSNLVHRVVFLAGFPTGLVGGLVLSYLGARKPTGSHQ